MVTDATTPGPCSIQSWWSFEPDHDHDLAVIDRLFRQSGGTTRYVGEWHSHHLGVLRPSLGDTSTMQMIASYERAQLDNPLSAIASRDLAGKLVWAVYQLQDGMLKRVTAEVWGDI